MPSPTPTLRSYPRSCVSCRQKEVRRALVDRELEIKYEGKLYKVQAAKVPAERCANCGATAYGVESEKRIDAALRDHLGLLQPEVIRKNRIELCLSQEDLAAALGCASESISRWERGTIVQSRATDRILRAYFELPQLRQYFGQLDGAIAAGEFAGSEVCWVDAVSSETPLGVDWNGLVANALRPGFRKRSFSIGSPIASSNCGSFPIRRYQNESVA